MSGHAAPWVAACHRAIDAAAAGECPTAAVADLPEDEAERALGAALPIIEKIAWVSDAILAEPTKARRHQLLHGATKGNKGLRQPIEARVRRLWKVRRSNAQEQLAAIRAYCEDAG